MFKDKGLLVGIVVTILLIAGGIYFFTKPQNSGAGTQSTKINEEILVPEGSYVTAGIANGDYLAATGSAKLTLVEFGDYECPACAQYHPLIKQLMTEFAGQINFAYRNFPLPQHKNAVVSAKAAEAAGLQGKFWQMNDKLYSNQIAWANSGDPVGIFTQYAQEFGLNIDQFKADMDKPSVKNKIDRDMSDGTLIKINSTPTYYLNGVKIDAMPSSYAALKNLVEAELAK